MKHRAGQALDGWIHASWPWFVGLAGNWVLYAGGWIGAPQMLTVIGITLAVLAFIGGIAVVWLLAVLVSDYRRWRA
ncbi:hypothetical protein [Nocardia sp. NPDC046763]|uniref:hypothetical protein n=1 Tax=Nocardia sp. NPDC046763 TaxID=3155256 RepID=UPI0033F431CD